jgi:hypothetical protein
MFKKFRQKRFVKQNLLEFQREQNCTKMYKKLYGNVQDEKHYDNVLIIEFNRKAFDEHLRKKFI